MAMPAIALALLAHASPLVWLAASRAECEAWLTALKQRLANVELSPRQAALYCAAEISWGFAQAWNSRAGIGVRGPWPSARQELQPLGGRWMAYCACFWALLAGWHGDAEAARAALDDARRLEQPDWPAWLPALRLSITINVSHMAGESAVEVESCRPCSQGCSGRETVADALLLGSPPIWQRSVCCRGASRRVQSVSWRWRNRGGSNVVMSYE